MWFCEEGAWKGDLGSCMVVLLRRTGGWFYRFEGAENGRKWVTTDEGPFGTAYLAGLCAIEEAKLYDTDRRLIEQLNSTLSVLSQ